MAGKKTGIGLLLDLALEGRATDPNRWKGERGGNVALPVTLRAGSHNYGPVARTLDRRIGRDDNHLDWLLAWYRGNNSGPLGHGGREILSPTYFDAHTVCACLNVQLCDERGDAPELRAEAIRWLEDELALCTIHSFGGRVVAAGTRALGGTSLSRDAWLATVLDVFHGARSRTRLKRFAKSFKAWFRRELVADCRAYLSTGELGLELDRVLARIRSAAGKLVWERYDMGHVSYFPVGPRCYSSPQMAAAVVVDERLEPHFLFLNPAAEEERRLTGITAFTRWEGMTLVSEAEGEGLPGGRWSGRLDLQHLGVLLTRRELPMPEEGGS